MSQQSDRSEAHFEVLWPLARRGVEDRQSAARLPDLNGKTIANTVYFTGGSLVGGTLLASQLVVEAGTISAILSGPGTFHKTGTGSLTISGANDFTGGTMIDDGVLIMGANNVLPGTITLNGGVENGRYGGVLAMGTFNNSNSTTIVFNGGDVTSTTSFTGILTGTSFTSTNSTNDASFNGASGID